MANRLPPRYEPTPEEIAAACAEIRSGWTPAETDRRRVDWDGDAWTVPEYHLALPSFTEALSERAA